MTTSPLTIVAIATAAPGQEASLRAAQEQLVAETVKEPGCLRYELHQSRENSQVLVLWRRGSVKRNGALIWRARLSSCFHSSGASRLIVDFSLFQMSLVTDGMHQF